MPFDATNFQEVVSKPDVFSLEGLIAWLETQEPETTYCYFNVGDCLLHRYFRNNGVAMDEKHGIGGTLWHGKGESPNCRRLPHGFAEVSRELPHTYGAALERARALLASKE